MVLAVTAASGFGSGAAPITGIQGVVFNGTDNYIHKSTAFTGAADSTGLTLSLWVKLNSNTAAHGKHTIISTTHTYMDIPTGSGGTTADAFYAAAFNTGFSAYLAQVASTATITVSDGWTHLLLAMNTNFSAGNKLCYVYQDGVDITGSLTDSSAAFTMDLTTAGPSGQWTFFASSGHNLAFLDGAVAEILFENTYVDITNSSERLKFRTSGGKPADVGADGSTPFGTQPLIYLSCKSSNAADIANNLGTGGGMTLAGSVTLSDTSPAD